MRRTIKSSFLLWLSVTTGCVSPASLENRPCPCATGFTCDTQRQLCVAVPQRTSPMGGLDASLDEGADATQVGGSCPSGAAVDRAQLVGRWLLTSGLGVFVSPAPPQNIAGMELTQDGKWSLLFHGDSGSLVQGQGFHAEGRWTSSGDLRIDNAFGTEQMCAGRTGNTLQVLFRGLYPASFSLDESGQPLAPAPTGTVDGAQADPRTRCEEPEGPVHRLSPNESLRDSITGRWYMCNMINTTDRGMDLASDGIVYTLLDKPGLPRRQDPYPYTWTLDEATSQVTVRNFQGIVDVVWLVSLSDSPRKIMMYDPHYEWESPSVPMP